MVLDNVYWLGFFAALSFLIIEIIKDIQIRLSLTMVNLKKLGYRKSASGDLKLIFSSDNEYRVIFLLNYMLFIFIGFAFCFFSWLTVLYRIATYWLDFERRILMMSDKMKFYNYCLNNMNLTKETLL